MVSLVAIGVLLVILNWFYHRVYWNEHLAGLHGKKKKILGAGVVGVAAAQLLALADARVLERLPRGLRDRALPAGDRARGGRRDVLLGVAVGLVGDARGRRADDPLQRKLPHKRMLMVTGALILCVLVVMVGTTVQTLQVVGWVPVTPVEGLQLPYWAGLWLGIFPTWEGCWPRCAAVASSCSAATSRPNSFVGGSGRPSSTSPRPPRPPEQATRPEGAGCRTSHASAPFA